MRTMNNLKYYCNKKIQSYNAIFHFIIGARNIGKTWSFKIRALKRFQKHSKKTIWVRRFANEVKATLQRENNNNTGFYTPKMLEILNTNKQDIKLQGNKICYNISNTDDKKYRPFIEVLNLSAQQKYKSVDDENIDTIVFDEFTTTPINYTRYHGNEVMDLMDLLITKLRENKIKVFFLGNKEDYINPYYNFFNIKPPKIDFQGIRTYKNNTIVLEQVNDYLFRNNEYEKKVETALEGTLYHNYLYGGSVKKYQNVKFHKMPSKAFLFLQFFYENNIFSIYRHNNNFYFVKSYDKAKKVYTFDYNIMHNKRYEIIHRTKDRNHLMPFIRAYKNFTVYCTNIDAIDAMNYFIKNTR